MVYQPSEQGTRHRNKLFISDGKIVSSDIAREQQCLYYFLWSYPYLTTNVYMQCTAFEDFLFFKLKNKSAKVYKSVRTNLGVEMESWNREIETQTEGVLWTGLIVFFSKGPN